MTIIVRIAKNYPKYEVEKINVYEEEAMEKMETIAKDLCNKLEDHKIEDFQIEVV